MPPLLDRDVRTLQRRIVGSLAERYVDVVGRPLNSKNQVARRRDAVVPTVSEAELSQSITDVQSGSGGELRIPKSGGHPPFHSIRSSCALAVSVFGPWRLNPSRLELAALTGFTRLQFEVKFPILDPSYGRKTPPNLDVVAWKGDHIVAVESKFVEQVDPKHPARIDALYDGAIKSAHPSWRARAQQLRRNPDRYRFFNAAQILKHYLGLKADRLKLIGGRPTTLMYLYWEPENPEAHPFFAKHRAEVGDFAEGVSDDRISFASLSYRELWDRWKAQAPEYLRQHVTALEARYLVRLADCMPEGSN